MTVSKFAQQSSTVSKEVKWNKYCLDQCFYLSMLLLHVYVQFYLQQLDNKFWDAEYMFLYTRLWFLTTVPQCFLAFRQHTPHACTPRKQFHTLKKKKKVAKKESYPKDISTTRRGELRDRVVLWNECLRELWQTPFASLGEANYREKLQTCLWHTRTVNAQSFISFSDLAQKRGKICEQSS